MLAATLLLPMCSGWQCWTAVGMGGGAATGGGHAGWGMGGATADGGGRAQHETGGGDGDCGSAGTLGEMS